MATLAEAARAALLGGKKANAVASPTLLKGASKKTNRRWYTNITQTRHQRRQIEDIGGIYVIAEQEVGELESDADKGITEPDPILNSPDAPTADAATSICV